MPEVKQNVCLICIDGWGISPEKDATGDAIRNAQTPAMTQLAAVYPYTTLEAHGLAVGLPEGLMGNSEVGHLNIGAGRVVYQDIVRIDLAVKNRELGLIANIQHAFERAKAKTGRLHFLGLVSDGGVHSHQNHLHALLTAAREAGVPKSFIHFFGDGRDTAPKSALTYLDRLTTFISTENQGYGTLGTITGRYYAMDRDKRWERVQLALDALLFGKGEQTTAAQVKSVVEQRYNSGETDEFLKPIIVDADSTIRDGDTLFFFNYRSDRMRQITASLDASITFSPLPAQVKLPTDLNITTMTQYKADYPFANAFPPQSMKNVLAEWLSQHSVKQCHIAETEKYAHVTFFFNGGTEAQFPNEERQMIASPKVATYDLKPDMSAKEVGDAVASKIGEKTTPFVMCNFAPPDMVGHTGKYEPAIHGVEATDKAIGVIYEACKQNGYVLFVTADHGNAEKMLAENGQPHTAHTTARVPFVMTSNTAKFSVSRDATTGALCDVAPTILDLMGLPIPAEMTGKSLLLKE
ncbi:hypothetical protein RI367_003139 [Sorochytrium milnesiophthora]